jgi:hypothetical protein
MVDVAIVVVYYGSIVSDSCHVVMIVVAVDILQAQYLQLSIILNSTSTVFIRSSLHRSIPCIF